MQPSEPQAEQRMSPRDEYAQSMIGRVVGDFEIRREIGRGGMGTVYEALQRSLQREVAIKILAAPVGMTRTSVERFQREAQAAAKLHHANIVPIYAQGEHEGIYYYAMELIRGQSVHQIIQEARRKQSLEASPLDANETQVMDDRPRIVDDSAAETMVAPSGAGSQASSGTAINPSSSDRSRFSLSGTGGKPSQATIERFDVIARLTATVADALHYAHQASVVHRDIKPHNLILGDDGRLCVSDFGLARMLEQPGVTITGEFIGSPLYMSPEQLSATGKPADHRTDVYSLGATLYEWITLTPPFPGQTREQVLSLIMTAEPEPPRQINSKIPVDLETICLKAMKKDPARRYATAADMSDDLHRFLERQALLARRAGPLAKFGKLVYRQRVPLLAASLVAVVAVFAGFVFWQRGGNVGGGAAPAATPTPVRPPAQVAVTTPQDDGLDSTSTTNNAVTAIPPRNDNASTPAQDAPATDGSQDPAEINYAEIGASIVDAIGAGSANQSRALSEFEQYVVEQLSNDLIGRQMRQFINKMQNLGTSQPTITEADQAYQRAVVANAGSEALQHLDTALALDNSHAEARVLKAVVLFRMKRFGEMTGEADYLLQQQPDSTEAFLLSCAGRLLLGAVDEVRADLEKALADDSATLLTDAEAWAYALAGLCYARLDNLGRATVAYNRALSAEPNHAVALFGRAKANYGLESYDAALADANRLVALLPNSAEALEFRGDCYNRLLRFEEALADYNAALDPEMGGNQIMLTWKIGLASVSMQQQQAQAEDADDREVESASPAEESVFPSSESALDEWLRQRNRTGRPN